MPTEVSLPLQGHFEAVYFLQACAWIDEPCQLGSYRIGFADSPEVEIPIRVLGGGFEADEIDLFRENSVLQDWWPGAVPLENDRVKALLCRPTSGSDTAEGNLYIYEWVNPHPHKKIRSLKIEIDPSGNESFGLIAVTGLKPAG